MNIIDPLGNNPPDCFGPDIFNPWCVRTWPFPGHPIRPTPLLPQIPTPPTPPSPSKTTIGPMMRSECSIDLFEAPGYVEGYASSSTFTIGVSSIEGKEVVYDFATLERATFEFEGAPFVDPKTFPYPGITTPELGFSNMTYYVDLEHFDNWKSLYGEYRGDFFGFSLSVGFSKYLQGLSIGAVKVFSPEVSGSGGSVLTGGGGALVPVSFSFSKTYYWADPTKIHRYVPIGLDARPEHIKQMKDDIQSGVDSPAGEARPYSRWENVNRLEAVWQAHKNYFMFQYHEYQPPK